ncbi:MAG TPA: MFS transporter [Lachnospiraceae bacterium]|nr:MFS transporter [Lachnospiraceae bacterium]
MEKLSRNLTLKFAFLQGTYWISQCIIGSFAAVYLRSKDFDNTQIGIILSLAAILSIVLQLTLGTFADKTNRITLRSIVIVQMLIAFSFSVLLQVGPSSLPVIGISFTLISAIQFTINPQFNSLAMEYINKGIPINYGLARGTGSICFAVVSPLLGMYVTKFGSKTLIILFLVSYCFLVLAAYTFKVSIPEYLREGTAEDGGLRRSKENLKADTVDSDRKPSSLLSFVLQYKKFTVHLLGIAMLFYSHNILNTYLINIIEHVGGNSTSMGISLSMAAAVELPTMAGFILLVKRIKCTTLLKASAFFFLLKIVIAWLAPNVAMIYLSQSIQMLGFALFTPASIYYVNYIIGKYDKVKGQSMLGVAICLASAIANITGGRILDLIGVRNMLLVGIAVTAVGFLIICLTTEKVDINSQVE